MTLATIAVEGLLFTNETEPIQGPLESVRGLLEVERNDANSVTVHFRDELAESALISGETTRAGAVALAHALLAAAESDD